jgi:hypothetical protein
MKDGLSSHCLVFMFLKKKKENDRGCSGVKKCFGNMQNFPKKCEFRIFAQFVNALGKPMKKE